MIDAVLEGTGGRIRALASGDPAAVILDYGCYRIPGGDPATEEARRLLEDVDGPCEIVVPDEYVGDIMGDVSSRRGRVQSSEARGSSQVIKAEVPMAEMLEYASSLTSLTGGKGAFQMEFSHYDEVPSQVQEKIIAEAKARQAEES